MNRTGLLTLLIGLVIGVTATSFYWQTRLEKDERSFNDKARCQKVAERYERDHPGAAVMEVEYSHERHSCLAMTSTSREGATTYWITDLLSGWQEFVGSCNFHEDKCEHLEELLHKQDDMFTKFLHTSSR